MIYLQARLKVQEMSLETYGASAGLKVSVSSLGLSDAGGFSSGHNSPAPKVS